jgi:formyl-CoA transferase
VLLRLLEGADVLVENFKAGTMEKWGIGYEAMLARKFPRLIHCRITGFGADGPMGAYPGYDAMVQAWAGLQSVNGAPESGPVRLGIPIVDLGTGMNAMIGILLALNERHRSGQGQFIDCTLYDTAVALLHPHAPNWFLNNKPPKLYGNSHGNLAPYNLFKTKGLPIVIGAGNDGQFRKLCAMLGKPELAQDARFATNRARLDNLPALTEALAALLKDADGEALAIKLMENGVPAGAVRDVPAVLQNEHTKHREMVVRIDDYQGTGIPVKLSRTPGSARTKPMRFGAENRAILKEAGYSPAEIEALIADGTVPAQPKKV